jgi:hypothetical protein
MKYAVNQLFMAAPYLLGDDLRRAMRFVSLVAAVLIFLF